MPLNLHDVVGCWLKTCYSISLSKENPLKLIQLAKYLKSGELFFITYGHLVTSGPHVERTKDVFCYFIVHSIDSRSQISVKVGETIHCLAAVDNHTTFIIRIGCCENLCLSRKWRRLNISIFHRTLDFVRDEAFILLRMAPGFRSDCSTFLG